MNNKEEVIIKCTKIFNVKKEESTAIYFKNEFNGTNLECILAIAGLLVDLENEQPEEYKAKFRADFMKYLNNLRSMKVQL